MSLRLRMHPECFIEIYEREFIESDQGILVRREWRRQKNRNSRRLRKMRDRHVNGGTTDAESVTGPMESIIVKPVTHSKGEG